MTRHLAPLLVLTALASAATARADAACPSQAEGFQRLAVADAEIAYRWEPAQLKVGQFFDAEVVDCATRDGRPVDRITIDATMPAHGHGMSYRPTSERMAAGRYLFKGLMLHMPGTWRFVFGLIGGDSGIQLTHDVDVGR
jgi:hypothetical protein